MHIIYYPDIRLTTPSKTVTNYTAEIESMALEMMDLMYKTDGIGLSAPQIGENYQLFVMNISGNKAKKEDERIFIDPIIELKGPQEYGLEGCLSFPGITGHIKRHRTVTITARTPLGTISETYHDLPARIIQHEVHHLQGIIFIELMTAADQRKNYKQLKSLRERFNNKSRTSSN